MERKKQANQNLMNLRKCNKFGTYNILFFEEESEIIIPVNSIFIKYTLLTPH